MAKVVSKLDLNKTPQLVDNNSLIFAKNIRVLKAGIIGPDFPIDAATEISGVILGYIVGLDSILYLFTIENNSNSINLNVPQFYNGVIPNGATLLKYSLQIGNNYNRATYDYDVTKGKNGLKDFVENTLIYHLGGTISSYGPNVAWLNSNYPFATTITVSYTYKPYGEEIEVEDSFSGVFELNNPDLVYNIYAFDEKEKNLTKLNTAWHWSGGKIHGTCTTNNTGDVILTVCEYFEDNSDISVPIKHINLSHSDVIDETLYTQTPNIPLTNLILHRTRYNKPIPNGVYQFFIRYKIYDNFYTEWFPCSEECFTGNIRVTNTIQGSIKYVDTTLNSYDSFIFTVVHLLNGTDNKPNYVKNFTEFQLGFIVSHDDSVNARAWKHFTMSVDPIDVYFDYDENFIEEINIDDLLKSVYEISNVKNVTYFRNKLYIANYKESNINENLSNYATDVECTIKQDELKVDISGINLPVIEGTTYYDISGRESEFINRIQNITKINSENGSGEIFKIYYSSYADFDPDVFFVRSGLDKSMNLTNSLPTFSLIPLNDDDDFESVNFRNTQNANTSIVGQLLYGGHGNHNYTRMIGSPNTVIYGKPTGLSKTDTSERYVYIHPLNDAIDWACVANDNRISTRLIDPDTYVNSNDIVGDANGYHIVSVRKQEGTYEMSKLYRARNVNWDTDTEAKCWDAAERHISKQIKDYIDSNYPTYILSSVKIYTNDGWKTIVPEDESPVADRTITNFEGEESITISNFTYNDFRGQTFTKAEFNTFEAFKQFCEDYITPTAIDANGNCYYKINNTYYEVYRVEIKYKYFEYSEGNKTPLTKEDDEEFEEIIVGNTSINSKATKYLMTLTYNVERLGVQTTFNIKSLLPFTNYNFYIHYVKENGVATNGYLVENKSFSLDVFDESYEHSVIYPTFDNISLPDGYIGCFFSIEKVGNDVLSCFNYRTEGSKRIVDCLDIDCMLYPLLDNITIINSNGAVITDKAKYYPSSATEPPIMLGNVGCIRWDEEDEYVISDDDSGDDSNEDSGETYPRLWVRILHQPSTANTNRLIKLTPYIIGGDFTDYTKLNIPGYYCSVCKPIDIKINDNENGNTWLYVNGSDVYEKSVQNNARDEAALSITEYEDLLAHVNTYDENYHVYSNFNLSYLSLYDMSYKDSKYKRVKKIDSETGEVIETYKQILFMLDSSTISYIYILPSMYKDYTRKLYNSAQSDKIYKFDNTVRSSDVNTDEQYKSIYKFFAEDYYMVPANKGKIVNLFNITQNIFIHCEHGLFKFSGSNTLSAKDTEVQLTENDVFDTGITELFDAQYGFAGLQHKEESLVTFNAYVFYDSIANIVYGYFGENNLVNISESIHKLIKERDISRILFTSDVENDRFFMNIIYNDSSNICLSFNFNLKSFTSIHDFNFSEGFYSRSNCYFLDNARRTLYAIDKIENVTNYSNLYKLSKLFNNDMRFDGEVVENCLDIVCNIEYEKVKVLNYVNWICNQINKYADDIDGVNLFVAEENISKYAGSKLRIYSDQCSTALIELEDANGQIYEQNIQTLANSTSYEYPRYNCGVWSLNYFRDVRNDDIFDSDKSLIYGKYFVLRLIFKNKNFKLENINFNIQNYEKV